MKNASLRDKERTADVATEFREASNKEISNQTVKARLLEAGLKECKARKRPYLAEVNKKKRLLWAKEH